MRVCRLSISVRSMRPFKGVPRGLLWIKALHALTCLYNVPWGRYQASRTTIRVSDDARHTIRQRRADARPLSAAGRGWWRCARALCGAGVRRVACGGGGARGGRRVGLVGVCPRRRAAGVVRRVSRQTIFLNAQGLSPTNSGLLRAAGLAGKLAMTPM